MILETDIFFNCHMVLGLYGTVVLYCIYHDDLYPPTKVILTKVSLAISTLTAPWQYWYNPTQ